MRVSREFIRIGKFEDYNIGKLCLEVHMAGRKIGVSNISKFFDDQLSADRCKGKPIHLHHEKSNF
ncbi:hypothetical protein B0E43_16305 [Algoriphagus sp. A40]|nr:hypothetical protein B0E43_16305 [Algoriphagus sp. A40]